MNWTILLSLYIGLPAIATLIFTVLLMKKYKTVMEELKIEYEWEKKYGHNKGKFIAISSILIPSVFYGFLSINLIYMGEQFEINNDIFDKVTFSCGIIIGFSGLSASIASGLNALKGVENILKDPYIEYPKVTYGEEYKKWQKEHEEELKKSTFTKYMMLTVIPHTIAIFSMLITILLFNFSGIMGGEEIITITSENVDTVITIGYIFAICSMSSILSGILPNKINGDITDLKIFQKKLIMSAIGITPCIFGIIISVFLMINNGII